MIANIF